MSRHIQIITPENIEVSYELAGVGSRFIAVLVDHVIQILAIIGVMLATLLSTAATAGMDRLFGGSAPWYFTAIAILVVFAIIFGYFVFFELLWAGRTPGKRLVGLRVVRDGGYPIDLYSSSVRNLVRLVDFLPPCYGIGIISIFVSSDYRRLGDYAAGTIVIKERAPAALDERVRGPASPLVAHFMPLVKNIDLVTADEFRVLHRFVQRRHELDVPVQAHIAMRLARPLIQRLGLEDVPVQTQWQYADLLEAIERRYVEERGVL